MSVCNRGETIFRKLSVGWNAEPNAPDVLVTVSERDIVLSFKPNPYQYEDHIGVSRIELTFINCARYRVGSINDEGWYRGQCRFSRIAPGWGEFYEVAGDLRLPLIPSDWVQLSELTQSMKHFLFYFRDEEFECDAEGWSKRDIQFG
jgi:hypothetical protein